MTSVKVRPVAVTKSSRKRPFQNNFAMENETIILSFGKGETSAVKLTRGKVTQNKFGALKHNDVIGKKFGSKVCMSRGFCYILALDPVNWNFSLPHRTQIIYPPDSSLIIGRLDLVPGKRVIEAGTGSGALTHALATAVWPSGRVRTFDFHEERVGLARVEFQEHQLDDVVTVNQRDIVGLGFPPSGDPLNPDGIHAVIIDLPEPWAVIPTLDKCFSPVGGRVCVFSPCIEQVQQACGALREAHFSDIEILECVQRTYDLVHTVLNVPNLGQKDASALMDGSYVFPAGRDAKRKSVNEDDDGEEEEEADGTGTSKPAVRPAGEKHLFPPPSKWLTPQTSSPHAKGNLGQHQDGSWQAYPKPKGTGHTGYLVFASLPPQLPASPEDTPHMTDV